MNKRRDVDPASEIHGQHEDFNADVQALEVTEATLLVVKYPRSTSQDQLEALVERFQSLFEDPKRDKVPWVIVPEDFDLSVLDQEAMLEHGWVRNASKKEEQDELVHLRKLAQILQSLQPVPVKINGPGGQDPAPKFMVVFTAAQGQEMTRLMGAEPEGPRLILPDKKLIVPGSLT